MARGLYKGRPSPALLHERMMIAQRFAPSAREVFASRTFERLACLAEAARPARGGRS